MKDRIGINLYPMRLAAAYLGTFGLMALLLAAIGLYGVVSLSVSRRTREVGIRMSIGADGGRVVAMVLKGSLKSVAVGAAIGLVMAIGLARLIQSFLFGVEAMDPATLVGAVPVGVRGVFWPHLSRPGGPAGWIRWRLCGRSNTRRNGLRGR